MITSVNTWAHYSEVAKLFHNQHLVKALGTEVRRLALTNLQIIIWHPDYNFTFVKLRFVSD